MLQKDRLLIPLRVVVANDPLSYLNTNHFVGEDPSFVLSG